MEFRDKVLKQYNVKLFDRKVEDAIKEGLVHDETGCRSNTQRTSNTCAS